jgi:hypothetical protein
MTITRGRPSGRHARTASAVSIPLEAVLSTLSCLHETVSIRTAAHGACGRSDEGARHGGSFRIEGAEAAAAVLALVTRRRARRGSERPPQICFGFTEDLLKARAQLWVPHTAPPYRLCSSSRSAAMDSSSADSPSGHRALTGVTSTTSAASKPRLCGGLHRPGGRARPGVPRGLTQYHQCRL